MITILQYQVLCHLPKDRRVFGVELREKLDARADSSFYGLMKRLEEAHLVKGVYATNFRKKMPVRQRAYRITKLGLTAKAKLEYHLANNT